jgi:hypothetical protein
MFWRALAYAIDRKMGEQADKQQAMYGASPGFLESFMDARRANRGVRQHWEDSQVINAGLSPHRRNPSGLQIIMGNRPSNRHDLGHPPGCICRWCS